MLLSCPIVRNGMDVQNVLDALFLLTVADWPKESGSLFATGLHAAPKGNLATCCRIILASLSFRPRGEGCYGAYGVGGGEEGGVVWAVARLLVHVGTRTSVQLLRATGIRFKSFMCQGREVFAGYPAGCPPDTWLSSLSLWLSSRGHSFFILWLE